MEMTKNKFLSNVKKNNILKLKYLKLRIKYIKIVFTLLFANIPQLPAHVCLQIHRRFSNSPYRS